jgi:hypothetical protein
LRMVFPNPWILWTFRVLLVVVALLGLVFSSGCTTPTVRVKAVYLTAPPVANVVIRYRGRELGFAVDVENVYNTAPPPPTTPPVP